MRRELSIQKRIFVYFILVAVTLVVAVMLVALVTLTLSGRDSVSANMQNNVNLAARLVELRFDNIKDTLRAFSTTSMLQNTLAKDYSKTVNPVRGFSSDVRTAIYSVINIEPFTQEMTLVASNGMTFLYPEVLTRSNESDLQEDWCKSAINRNGMIKTYTQLEYIQNKITDITGPSNLVFEKSVIQIETGQCIGAIQIKVKEGIFSSTFPEISRRVGGSYFIINGQGDIISSVDESKLFTSVADNSFFREMSPGNVSLHDVDGQKMLIAVSEANVPDWYVVGMIPLHTIYDRIFVLLATIFLVGILFTGLAVFLSSLLSRRIVKPIKALVIATQDVSSGNLGTQIEVTSQDEIGQLSMSFNRMLQDIRDLTHKIWLEQRQKREYALQFMQAQINPHLLYNSITSISYLITIGQHENASSALEHLGGYYKKVLQKNAALITIQDDIELCIDYLKLQIRIQGDLFTYSMNIDPNITDYPALKLTLQPIVENSILHGLKNYKTSGGLIELTGSHNEGVILLQVRDNGRGMPQKKLDELLTGSISNTQHYALINIHQRIQLRFGTEYGLSFHSVEGEGTTVTVRLPYHH